MDSNSWACAWNFSTPRCFGLHGRRHYKQAAERNEEKDDEHDRATQINEACLRMLDEYVWREG